jgi:DNA polymerase-3 subunit gamma/tau
MARISAAFSEEDLTRYLQLALDLFRDLQFSLQPRFHLEIGLLKMVQAGKLVSIEDALASIGTQPIAPKPTPKPPITAAPTWPPDVRSGPSPFELDRVKKTAAAAPVTAATSVTAASSVSTAAPAPVSTAASASVGTAVPSASDDWRAKLHGAMTETGLTFSADAIAQSEVALVNNELQITTSKQFQLDLGREEVLGALKHLGFPALRFKINFGEVKASPEIQKQTPKPKEDEVTERALSHPEVQRFRELFGGEVRTVRNLKEPWNE